MTILRSGWGGQPLADNPIVCSRILGVMLLIGSTITASFGCIQSSIHINPNGYGSIFNINHPKRGRCTSKQRRFNWIADCFNVQMSNGLSIFQPICNFERPTNWLIIGSTIKLGTPLCHIIVCFCCLLFVSAAYCSSLLAFVRDRWFWQALLSDVDDLSMMGVPHRPLLVGYPINSD